MDDHPNVGKTGKDQQLETFTEDPDQQYLTTDHGVRLSDTDNSLRAGVRGPTLLEDFHLREKLTRFDHERIPERVVHARGTGAHGYFQVYESLADLTSARFLQDPERRTPVFVRFSTVAGSRGSADTARDVRGFATKFYTDEGNFDLVGNNIPVFFIQDGIKFPDFVHAVKPEPHNEMPQAASAHDSFYDFVSLVPETMHMLMWVMSDRAIPRSFRMMEGFGVHTFRLVNDAGKARFIKWHWKPLLGMHSLTWDEAQKLAGQDPDWLRRDLWEAIEQGDYPEYELGLQVIEEENEFGFDFDLLDATKLVPEELVPVQRIGKMTLNRNPDNFFAEVEQVAFLPSNVVPGIDFTNDPLLQARLFSYIDTQLTRLGGPNFAEIPINRPVAPVHNNQQDGHMRQTINRGQANYFPNTIGGGCPMVAAPQSGGYAHYTEKVDGHTIRARSASFTDHFSQATLFWNSMSDVEKAHIVGALQFELAKVERKEIRQRMIGRLAQVAQELAQRVGAGLGIPAPAPGAAPPPSGSNDGTAQAASPSNGGATPAPAAKGHASAATAKTRHVDRSPALSMMGTVHDTIKSRRIAILVADGVLNAQVGSIKQALEAAGAHIKIVAPTLNPVQSAEGTALTPDMTVRTAPSVTFDGVLVPGGAASVQTLAGLDDVLQFIHDMYKHCKTLAVLGDGADLLAAARLPGQPTGKGSAKGTPADAGLLTGPDGGNLNGFARQFIAALAQHRHWAREQPLTPPA